MKIYLVCGGEPQYGLDSPPEAFTTKEKACDYLFELGLEWFADCPYKDEESRREWQEDALRFTNEVKNVKNNEVSFPIVISKLCYTHTILELETDSAVI